MTCQNLRRKQMPAWSQRTQTISKNPCYCLAVARTFFSVCSKIPWQPFYSREPRRGKSVLATFPPGEGGRTRSYSHKQGSTSDLIQPDIPGISCILSSHPAPPLRHWGYPKGIFSERQCKHLAPPPAVYFPLVNRQIQSDSFLERMQP